MPFPAWKGRKMRLPLLRSTAVDRRLHTVSVLFLSLILCSFLGCGGSSPSSSPSLKPQAVPPSITAQPQSQNVTEPAAATFSVQATGTAPLVYQWNKGGSPITGATSATYALPATSAGETGTSFTVTVTNSAGSVTSAAALLTVNLSPASVAAIAGGGQSATVSTPFAANLQATVTDSSGIPIANELVTFSSP